MMSKFTVELGRDDAGNIVVQVLKDQFNGLVDRLERRKDGSINLGLFSTDKEEDIAEIQKYLDSIKTVLAYNMTHKDFEEWKNDH
jgi:hypothetical protein